MEGQDHSFITLSDLYKAYRKAKSDAFHDKMHFSAVAFTNYEQKLDRNLRRLLRHLLDPKAPWSNDVKFIGGYSYLPKSLEQPMSDDVRVIHFATLDSIKDWEAQCEQSGRKMEASFRQIMTPTVDYQVVSALWLIKVGCKFDRAIDKNLSYAHNLRRLGSNGPISADSNLLFVPYINGYKKWRSNGLKAMRAALAEGKSIIAVTMDIQKFYHSVSPNFILRQSLAQRLLIALSAEDRKFTGSFIKSINAWYASTPDAKIRPAGALPVGLSASRVISNVLLAEFDRAMAKELNVVYYGRYADDIFLVVERPEKIYTGEKFIRWLRKKMQGWLVLQHQEEGSGLRLRLPYAVDSDIVFSSAKQKIFFLDGEYGSDLLDQIVEKIREQSSEYRKLPELPSSESKMVAQALLATPDARLEADALRKAEAVSIRRFGFSMLLGDIEAYARDLEPNEWEGIRHKFYGLVSRYVVTPAGIFDYFAYIVRVFGIMVASRDLRAAEQFLDRFNEVCRVVLRTTSAQRMQREQFRLTRRHYFKGFAQVAEAASSEEGFEINVRYRRLLTRALRRRNLVSRKSAAETSMALLKADLGRRPYHDYWLNENLKERVQPQLPDDISVRRVLALTRQFRGKVPGGLNAPFWPAIAFPTRPIPLWSLCIAAPALMAEPGGLEKLLWATRGSKTNPRYSEHVFISQDDGDVPTVNVPNSLSANRKFGVPSYLTTKDQWDNSFNGTPDLSIARYVGLRRLINKMLDESPDIRYIAFPECSVPLKWGLQIAQKLGSRGVSFIAGIENRGAGRAYTNEALVSLASNYFGPAGAICFIQPKLALAHHESIECSGAGKLFATPSPAQARPVYVHGGFCFGVLICSDLTTIANRAYFQGRIDALFVLEWNRDLTTFHFLVEAAAHDLHAAIVQINNRAYGDSRIRMPFSESHRRDVVQVKGGDENFYVVSSINFGELRAFQRDQIINETYKPLPIGFEMSEYRHDSLHRQGW